MTPGTGEQRLDFGFETLLEANRIMEQETGISLGFSVPGHAADFMPCDLKIASPHILYLLDTLNRVMNGMESEPQVEETAATSQA